MSNKKWLSCEIVVSTTSPGTAGTKRKNKNKKFKTSQKSKDFAFAHEEYRLILNSSCKDNLIFSYWLLNYLQLVTYYPTETKYQFFFIFDKKNVGKIMYIPLNKFQFEYLPL
jgi:hypothetical protein